MNLTVSPLTLRNLVVSLRLNRAIKLPNYTNHSVFYETELFPACLIRKWKPAHIAVFHNGHCVITGLKSLDEAHTIVKSLTTFLENK